MAKLRSRRAEGMAEVVSNQLTTTIITINVSLNFIISVLLKGW